MSAYAASKGGILSMTQTPALEFAKDGIRFNSVAPGSISSGMTDGTGQAKQSVGPGLPDDADYSLFSRLQPMLAVGGRAMFAKPEAVASVVAMLGSPGRLLRHRNRGARQRRHPHVTGFRLEVRADGVQRLELVAIVSR